MIETQVSKGIVSTYFDKLQRNLDIDVAIVGGGLLVFYFWQSSQKLYKYQVYITFHSQYILPLLGL